MMGYRSMMAALMILSCGPADQEPTPVHERCWEGYDDPTAALGSVEPGPALEVLAPFQPFEDPPAVQVFEGVQGGHHVYLSARIEALNPGDPAATDLRSVNPRTLYNLYRASGEKLNLNACPLSRAYEVGEGSRYELDARMVVLDDKLLPDAYGEEVRLVAEVLDCDGLYAHDERWVTVLAPIE